jgi:hypothetical protein
MDFAGRVFYLLEGSRSKRERKMRRFLLATVAVTAACVWVGTALGGAFVAQNAVMYVDGVQYRTVDTPAFYNEKAGAAPAHTWDTLYVFPSSETTFFQLHVADAAPGDRDYNGGRWIVKAVFFTTSYASAAAAYGGANGVLDNDGEVLAAIAGGAATATEAFRFECPVRPLPRNG